MKAIDYWTCDKCGKRIYADPCEHCGGVEPSMHDELKRAVEAAKSRVELHSKGFGHREETAFLATHGDALIAAVALADLVDDESGVSLSAHSDDVLHAALDAYRAATQERRGS